MTRGRRLPLLALLLCLVVAGCTGEQERPQQPARPKAKPVSVLWSTDLPVSALESSSVGGSRLREVQGILSELGAKRTAKGIVITLPEVVLFDFDKADIRPDGRPVLAKIAKVVAYYAGAPVRIEGHTDAVGTPAYNQDLSNRRANAVKDWLVTQEGVAAGRLQASGLGETRPVAPNQNPDGSDNPAGRQQNRRVEVVILTR
jgi:outer membrane protein OmpA-like peptidoglycan-associated protein